LRCCYVFWRLYVVFAFMFRWFGCAGFRLEFFVAVGFLVVGMVNISWRACPWLNFGWKCVGGLVCVSFVFRCFTTELSLTVWF